MPKYIDVEQFICSLDGSECLDTERDYEEIERRLEEFESADVQEVKHGKWKLNSYYCDENNCFDITVSCSKCGKEYCRETVADVQDSDEMFNYCPNCGAKMDGE